MTKEECEHINEKFSCFIYNPDHNASDLSLVLCTKSEEYYKVVFKTLEGYPSVLTMFALRYLPGKHIDSSYNNAMLHLDI